MKFPEGRVYTIQLTAEELIWLLTQSFLWKDYRGQEIAESVQLKIHKANGDRQQDNAVAYLYESSLKRQKWLEEKIRECYKTKALLKSALEINKELREQCTGEHTSN